MNVFKRIVVADFEYEVRAGELPNVLCMVAYVLDENLQHVSTIKKWRGEFDSQPPFDIGDDTLFVAYSAWAEMTCFLTLGWDFPKHVFDLHTAYQSISNVLLPREGGVKIKAPRKRLPDACRAYGVAGWENIDKGSIATDIGEGRWQDNGQQAVFEYCEEDVRASAELLRRQVRDRAVSVKHVLRWSNYSAKAVAQIQARGIPIDVALWNLVQENKAAVVAALVQQFDPSQGSECPIYTLDGETNYRGWEHWLASVGITAWPRTETGMLSLSSDTLRMMSHCHPGIEGLNALRDGLRFIVNANLPIGRDGRNRPSLFPFGTATGRNAHAKSPFNCHAGMRSFIKFPADAVGVYLDWRTQEVGVAADLSGDQALVDAYNAGDVYHQLALVCGFTDDPDPVRWKKSSPDVRDRMKKLQLGINYGMGVPSLARGLGCHPLVAANIIDTHQRTYPRFWEWREDVVNAAMVERKIESVFGWPLLIGTSPNRRALYNFPMQSGGAEMLRLAAERMCEAGITPSMTIHDALLLEVRDEEQIEHAKEIMRSAARDVCPSLEIGADADQVLRNGERYRDKRPMAKKMWNAMMQTLQDVGALPPGELP